MAIPENFEFEVELEDLGYSYIRSFRWRWIVTSAAVLGFEPHSGVCATYEEAVECAERYILRKTRDHNSPRKYRVLCDGDTVTRVDD